MVTSGMRSTSSTHLRWSRDRSRVNWDEFVHYQRRADEVYVKAGSLVRVRMFPDLVFGRSDERAVSL